ncbi:permease prefix domain 1-containing protein [Butyrivibrio sp. FC2001]|nr:permease prefix domain 1-containing protein [Butyrivibrio sp. FC2001]
MEEYIKKLLEQVRFKKAHRGIAEEIIAHIEDQIEDNMAAGMDLV